MHTDPLFLPASSRFQALQEGIVTALERLDGGTFRRDDWTRAGEQVGDGPALHGFGRTCVLEDGPVLEKAGVAFSQIRGRYSEAFAASMPGEGLEFCATGISIVLHPRNPFVPTIHMNYRRLSRGSHGWFGGGADLTPYYFDPDDAAHFHATHRAVCDQHRHVADWPRLVRDCDRYFTIPHRGERRGLGGLFFDHGTEDPEAMFAFVQAAGDAFLPAWLPLAERHKDHPYGERERNWQLVRRGRYVEFNLIHDRGTIYGLKTGGRIESILMSLPRLVSWQYDFRTEPGSPEQALLDVVRAGYVPEGLVGGL
jgi:coproporphyrinogen III oxidase